MPKSISELYQILGVPVGSDADILKKRHRDLVRKWHPDRFTDAIQKEQAEKKLAQINAAYHRLKKVKSRNINKAHSPKSATKTSGNKRSRRDNAKYADSETKRNTYSNTKTKRRPARDSRMTFEQTWLDRKLTVINNRMQQAYLQRRKDSYGEDQEKEIEKQEAFWFQKRKAWYGKTRVGLYNSFLNYLIFGNLENLMNQKESTATSLGSYNLRDKYELEIRHNIIRDRLFYAVNRTPNIILKYIFGIAILSLFIINISEFFVMGRIVGSLYDFLSLQIFVLGLFALLVFPDNLYQRFLLWKYRNLESNEVDKVFKNKKLPSPWQAVLYAILIPKYSLLTLFVFF